MNYTKLVALSTAVITIGGYVFSFNSFNSKDGLIKQGVDKLKGMVQDKDAQLNKLQEEYNALMNDLNSTEDALEQARIKLQQIYQKITGQQWDEANGDILDFDFESLLKDSDQYDNNVDGDAIGAVLGLPAGCSTEDIINAINDLIATVQSLEARIEVLEGQVANLQAEIATYEAEQDALVEEVNGLKAKLDAATAEANAIIDGANAEEQAQLDYINGALTELGEEAVQEQVPEEPEQEANQLFVAGSGWEGNENKDTVLAGLNSLGLTTSDENAKVTVSLTSTEGGYQVSIDNEEVYNQIIADSNYKNCNNRFYISKESNTILNKAQANGAASGTYVVVMVNLAN